MSELLVYLLAGLAAVYGFILFVRRRHSRSEFTLYAAALVVAAGIYVAFGLVLGGKPLGFELVQLVGFTALAVIGLRYAPVILAAGWLLHAGWDALHVLPSLSQHVPEWYVFACLSFDVALAGYIVANKDRFGRNMGPSIPKPALEE